MMSQRFFLELLEAKHLLTGTVSGTVFYDNNGNGVRDGSEPAVQVRRLVVETSLAELEVETNEAGQYKSPSIENGDVSVLLPLKNGEDSTGVSVATEFFGTTLDDSPTAWSSVVGGDLNGDGALDVAYLDSDSGSVWVRWGPDFQETLALPEVGERPISLVIADFDSDTLPDLAFANRDNSSVRVLRNDGNKGFFLHPTATTIPTPKFMLTDDFNGDGKPDLAVSSASRPFSLSILMNDGEGFQPTTLGFVGRVPSSFASVDINADGDADLVVPYREANRVCILLNSGAGEFDASCDGPVRVDVPLGSPRFVTAGDFTNDDVVDIAVVDIESADSTKVHLFVRESPDDEFSLVDASPALGRPYGMINVDGDQDGDTDLALVTDDGLIYLENTGGGTFLSQREISGVANLSNRELPFLIGAASDVTGAPKLVFAATLPNEETVSLFEAHATASLETEIEGQDVTALDFALQIGDFTGDRVVDEHDIDAAFAAIRSDTDDSSFDLNNDKVVDSKDVDFLIQRVLGTKRGDADLNGIVDFTDFLILSNNFGSNTSSWKTGDFNGDGVTDFEDFLLLSEAFGS